MAPSIWGMVATLFEHVEAHGRWPSGCRQGEVVMLPKQGPGAPLRHYLVAELGSSTPFSGGDILSSGASRAQWKWE